MKYWIVLLFLLSVIGVSGQVKNVDITTIKEREMTGKFLVDVRTPEEFAEGHIKGALNLNYDDPDFAAQWKDIDRETPVYLYCGSGKRSTKAAGVLDSLGFEKIFNLKGGYRAWKKAKDKKKPGNDRE
ncbi:rhodanese-like domain-containing protein [Sinomicrobium weinanense]|uniref:Rhodanese-like domain-containing protein n=1 Tax=Sinomicrobium weinanense TaxID=2842200 RepID=A0A926Q278_9FLAO|nr:rhodanese-like domain-containing protein [Sinomicrobium weinanense]MBC9795564.1 rhodanese-like domain-containing protein [Sinomicrobium weinanense]MBU3124585.1 rhodanese-like domain-containing protein [Sinomicrobium weinanense]